MSQPALFMNGRRLLGGRGHLTNGDQGQLDSGLSEPHTVASVNANALLHSLTIYKRTEGTVIEKNEFVAVVHECAMAPRDSSESVR